MTRAERIDDLLRHLVPSSWSTPDYLALAASSAERAGARQLAGMIGETLRRYEEQRRPAAGVGQ